MGILEKLRAKSKHWKKDMTAIYYAYQHPKVSRLPRIIILFTLGYALSPIDLIPDCIPILGYVDDLIIIPALMSLSIHLIPQDILEEARKKAEQEPLQLKNNWFFAVIFMLIWILLLTVTLSELYRIFSA